MLPKKRSKGKVISYTIITVLVFQYWDSSAISLDVAIGKCTLVNMFLYNIKKWASVKFKHFKRKLDQISERQNGFDYENDCILREKIINENKIFNMTMSI